MSQLGGRLVVGPQTRQTRARPVWHGARSVARRPSARRPPLLTRRLMCVTAAAAGGVVANADARVTRLVAPSRAPPITRAPHPARRPRARCLPHYTATAITAAADGACMPPLPTRGRVLSLHRMPSYHMPRTAGTFRMPTSTHPPHSHILSAPVFS